MSINPKATRELLAKLDHLPNKRLGQNFLIDANIVQKSIKMAGIQPGEPIVEIGPGLGTLTAKLLENGATVWCVERDHRLATHLRHTLFAASPQLQLLEGDCLEHPRAGLSTDQARTGFKIVANLPYAVSTPWMDAILAGPLPSRMVLMLQKEAADRYTASHGNKTFGAISIFLQSAYTVQNKYPVSARCFYPAPKVDSTLLCLELRANAVHFSSLARNFIRQVFTQRRKQLYTLCKNDPRTEVAEWLAQLTHRDIEVSIRPEKLALPYWQLLAKMGL